MSTGPSALSTIRFSGYAENVSAVWQDDVHLGFVELTTFGWQAYGTDGLPVGRRRRTRPGAAAQLTGGRRSPMVPGQREPGLVDPAPVRARLGRRSLLARRG